MLHPAFATQQRTRWMRPDASRWLRPDAATFLKSGTDTADVYPALASARDRERHAHDREIDAALADERAALERLRSKLAAVKSDLAWRRLLDAVAQKYSPDQPRVPAGETGGGQWTSGSGGSGRPRVIINTTDFEDGGELGDDGFDAFGDQDIFADDFDDDFFDDDVGFGGTDDSSGRAETDNRFDDSDSRPRDSDRSNDRDSSNKQPRRINDTRIVSDADPEPVRPGERYAQVDEIRDAAGRPYYEDGGHHEMSKATYKKWNLRPETRRIFDKATTGTLPKGTVRFHPDGVPYANRWGGPNNPHADYNIAIAELSEKFLQKNVLKPEDMTPLHALDLLAEIRGSDDPRIRDFNRAMRMLRQVFRFRLGRGE